MVDVSLGDDDEPRMWNEFYAEIDRRLDAIRPPRVGVNEREWREPVYGWARNHIPNESELVRRFGEKEVDRREGQATKRGNRKLKEYLRGQGMLFWDDIGALPITVGELRVRLDTATWKDVREHTQARRALATQRADEEFAICDFLDELARRAKRRGLSTIAQLGDMPPRSEAV